MADDEWKLKAKSEQFEVFNKLTENYTCFVATDLKEIINKVDVVIKQQLRNNGGKTANLRHISTELIRAIPEQETNLWMSYVVVVTNEVTNDNLCKVPVFRVLVGNQHTFVDISGSVYKSWETFMKNNDLPNCKFCYPANGAYDVGGKLEIEFALSPAASLQKSYWFMGGIVICAAIVAGTFFFTNPPFAYEYASKLIPFAERFLSKVLGDIYIHFKDFVDQVQCFRRGEKDTCNIMIDTFNFLHRFYSTYKEEVDSIWEKIKKTLSAVYKFLCKKFHKYFKKASNRSQQDFLAIVLRVEKEMSLVEEEAENKINEMNRALNDYKSLLKQFVGWLLKAYIPVNLGFFSSGMYNVPSYNQAIFQSCLSTSAISFSIKNQVNRNEDLPYSEPFTSTTENLLILSENMANESDQANLSDVKDILENLSCIVKDEYKNKIDTYIRGVQAAQAASWLVIDLDTYNKSLGIVGNPKDYYMKQAMQSIKDSRLAYRLEEKIKETKMDTKIYLIPICKKSEEDDVGVYKTNGVRGNGKFSAQWLLKVLTESFINLEESTLVVNETESVIYIRSEEVSIFCYQEVNDENTSEGLLYFNRY